MQLHIPGPPIWPNRWHVYVASKFENKAEVRECQTLLRQHGHLITHDWTFEEEAERTGEELETYLQKCAADDFNGSMNAEAFILIMYPGLSGALVKLGIAMASNARIMLVQPDGRTGPSPIFFHMREVERYKTIQEAVEALDA